MINRVPDLDFGSSPSFVDEVESPALFSLSHKDEVSEEPPTSSALACMTMCLPSKPSIGFSSTSILATPSTIGSFTFQCRSPSLLSFVGKLLSHCPPVVLKERSELAAPVFPIVIKKINELTTPDLSTSGQKVT